MAIKVPKNRRLIAVRAVQERTGLGHTSIYSRVAAGTFPQPVRLSSRCTRWYSDEIDTWLERLALEARGVGPRPGRKSELEAAAE